MNIAFRCPHCQQTANLPCDDDTPELECPHCERVVGLPPEGMQDGRVTRCLVCPSKELFVRKNFPQRLGVAIVVLGFAISCVTWYLRMVVATFGVLFATAGIDVLLYLLMGEVLECYRCGAQYSGTPLDEHGAFDLEVHERHRQEKLRLKANS